MNKIISILLIFSIFYSINCISYTSSELANTIRNYIRYEYFALIDLESLVSPSYFGELKELIDKMHVDDTIRVYLIFIEEFDFSYTDKNHYMNDFMDRIPINKM